MSRRRRRRPQLPSKKQTLPETQLDDQLPSSTALATPADSPRDPTTITPAKANFKRMFMFAPFRECRLSISIRTRRQGLFTGRRRALGGQRRTTAPPGHDPLIVAVGHHYTFFLRRCRYLDQRDSGPRPAGTRTAYVDVSRRRVFLRFSASYAVAPSYVLALKLSNCLACFRYQVEKVAYL